MIPKKNKYVKSVLLLILASCSSTPINLISSSDQSYTKVFKRDLQDIRAYNAFFKSDLEIMQGIIDDQKLSQSELRDLKLLKKNYQKILKKNKYQIELNPNQKYSEKLIELSYQFNLPINITWDKSKPNLIPKNLLQKKIGGFCASLYDDSITSINKEIGKIPGAILIIFSEEYASVIKNIKQSNSKIYFAKYDSDNFQEFAGEILGINLSKSRFKKISGLNPNQTVNFNPRSRSDIKQIVMVLKPQEFKAMIPALRYHSRNKFKYVNFVSSLQDLSDPLELLDYEDSYSPISIFLSKKIKNEDSLSMEFFLEYGALGEWLLDQVFSQAGIQSATVNGATGTIFYNSNTCNKREISLQKISSDLFST
tara:strand:- start:1606 stop:2706 length:1101 start_codon:yes stop_codon:yes gene_type:complete